MNAITYDTLSVSKRLKSSGIPESHAEAIAHEIQEAAMEDHLVTKDFLRDQLTNLEMRMTIKTGSMFIALGTLMIAIKFFG
jgi:hypothetical protein